MDVPRSNLVSQISTSDFWDYDAETIRARLHHPLLPSDVCLKYIEEGLMMAKDNRITEDVVQALLDIRQEIAEYREAFYRQYLQVNNEEDEETANTEPTVNVPFSSMKMTVSTSDFWDDDALTIYEKLSHPLLSTDICLKHIEEGLAKWNELDLDVIWNLLWKRNEIASQRRIPLADIEAEYRRYQELKQEFEVDATPIIQELTTDDEMGSETKVVAQEVETKAAEIEEENLKSTESKEMIEAATQDINTEGVSFQIVESLAGSLASPKTMSLILILLSIILALIFK